MKLIHTQRYASISRSARKAKEARQKRLNDWMPRFAASSARRWPLLLPFLALTFLSACSTPQAIFKQLKDDPASARIRVTGWGVVIEVDRTSPRTNTLPHSVGSERIDVGEQPR